MSYSPKQSKISTNIITFNAVHNVSSILAAKQCYNMIKLHKQFKFITHSTNDAEQVRYISHIHLVIQEIIF